MKIRWSDIRLLRCREDDHHCSVTTGSEKTVVCSAKEDLIAI